VIVMTQYLLAIYRDYAVPVPPAVTRQKWDGVIALKDKMADVGALVFQGGLVPAESATVVRQSGGDFLMTDGPYTETKEHLAGFFLINAADRGRGPGVGQAGGGRATAADRGPPVLRRGPRRRDPGYGRSAG
jgi:hypothetical protein